LAKYLSKSLKSYHNLTFYNPFFLQNISENLSSCVGSRHTSINTGLKKYICNLFTATSNIYNLARKAYFEKPTFYGFIKYRLVVKINFPAQTVYIRFIGTHKEYDQVHAEEI